MFNFLHLHIFTVSKDMVRFFQDFGVETLNLSSVIVKPRNVGEIKSPGHVSFPGW